MIPLIYEAIKIRKAVKMARKAVKKNPVKRKEQRASGDLFDAVKAVKKAAAPKRQAAPKHKATKAAPKPKKRAAGRNRPRVSIVGNTAVFGDKSPWKGVVTRANPGARVLLSPCKIELSAADMRGRIKGGKPSAALISDILDLAAQSRKDWDHVEVTDTNGKHLFDLA